MENVSDKTFVSRCRIDTKRLHHRGSGAPLNEVVRVRHDQTQQVLGNTTYVLGLALDREN